MQGMLGRYQICFWGSYPKFLWLCWGCYITESRLWHRGMAFQELAFSSWFWAPTMLQLGNVLGSHVRGYDAGGWPRAKPKLLPNPPVASDFRWVWKPLSFESWNWPPLSPSLKSNVVVQGLLLQNQLLNPYFSFFIIIILFLN